MSRKVIKHFIAGELVLVLLVCAGLVYKKHMSDSHTTMTDEAKLSDNDTFTGVQAMTEQITLDYEQTIEQNTEETQGLKERLDDLLYTIQEEKTEQSTNKEGKPNINAKGSVEDAEEVKDYIKWIDFDVTCAAMDDAYEFDVESVNSKVKLDWIELLAYLGAKYGGDFSRYRRKDMDEIVDKLVNKQETMEELTKDMQYYNYYHEAYQAVLGGFVGTYEAEIPAESEEKEATWETRYGLKAYLPLAKNFPYSDYDDFGVSRTYGFRRQHLGHDMMGQVGTPVVAVESGYVEALGWNQYGGWRIGIRSLDGKRYYYYAHLRKNFPYVKTLEEGSIVQAGDVIGYLGRTGYSRTENTNNIDTPHLHFGIQIIFDESQKECNNEIWIDCYEIVKFLYKNRSETMKNEETKEWYRIHQITDPNVIDYKQKHGIE